MSITLTALCACTGCFDVVDDDINEETDTVEEETDTVEEVVEEESPITWTECGQRVGDNPCDFSLTDQNGDVFTLYDNYGTLMLIDFSTMWCYYCQVAAQTAQHMQDTYGSQDFLYITVLVEDSSGDEVGADDLQEWVDTFGITTAPVLAGSRDLVDLTAEEGYPITGWPTFVLIDREMVLAQGLSGWSEETITGWVENAIGN